MQRSIEQRQAPSDAAKRGATRACKPFGFTARQLPFIYVLVGNWLFSAAFFAGAKLVLALGADRTGRSATASPSSSRMRCSPSCRRVIGICIVAAQRLDPKMWVGRTAKPNSALDINTRFILNTFEQFILYFIGNAGACALLPAGRSAHADHSHHPVPAGAHPVLDRLSLNPYLRAFGFGITFYPTVARLSLARPVHGVRDPHPALSERAPYLGPAASAAPRLHRPDEHQHVERQIVADHEADEQLERDRDRHGEPDWQPARARRSRTP